MSVSFPHAERRRIRFLCLFVVLGTCLGLITGLSLEAQDANGGDPNNGAPPSSSDSTGPVAPPDAAPPPSDDSISFQTFYNALASEGTWIQSSDYGYIWQPNVTDPNWAPYTVGHWVYTDDGWTWVSDEPWGWATYHYGRWVNLDGQGWCWVPGYTWAPAWVSWRYGDGYAGWAPLPPDSFVGVDYTDGDEFDTDGGFHIGSDCDSYYGIGAGCYIFLPVIYLGYPDYRHRYCRRNGNYGLINRTANVTNLNVSRNGTSGAGAFAGGSFHHVTVGGPSLAEVNAASQTPVPTVRLQRTGQPNGGGALTGNTLALYAPHVSASSGAQPERVGASIGQSLINHGADIAHPLAVNSRLSPPPATAAEVQEAGVAQQNAPATAKVLTSGTAVRPVLQAPLESLRPTVREVYPAPTAPGVYYNPGVRSAPGVAPETRSYPGAAPGAYGTPSHSYSPGTTYPGAPPTYLPHPGTPAGGSVEGHVPGRPEGTPSAPPETGGGYRGSSGASSGGEAAHPEGGGSGGGESRGGGSVAPAGGATGGPGQQGH
jgi:hypothetical protein